MKMKSIVMCAITGLLTASLSYMTPAMADDSNANQSDPAATTMDSNTQQGQDNNASMGSSSNPGDMN